MNSDPSSSTPSLLQRKLYGTLGITLLVALYLLVGLTGHDPWRGDDARHFGPVWSMLHGEGWLFPHIAGQAHADFPPLFYWVAALGSWLSAALLPAHDGARLASALFTALTVYCVAQAAQALYGRPARTPAALLTLGALGLVLHAHETQPMLAVIAMQALTLRGLARMPHHPVAGSVTAGAGSALAFLAGGLPGALLTMLLFPLMALSRDCQTARTSSGLMLGLTIACALGALWPLAVHLLEPELFSLWLHGSWNALGKGPASAEEVAWLLELLGWFTWPLWPIALWGLWRGRRQLDSLPLLLPALAALLALLWLLMADKPGSASALVLIPPLALLAAGGAPTLRRGAAKAFEWFGLMNFAVFGLLVWIAWTAQALGWPPGLSRHLRRAAPEFQLHGSEIQLATGLLICLLWVVLVRRLPRSPSSSAANWAMGMTMLWCLAVSLLMPWFDHGRSYRPAMKSLEHAVANEMVDCIAGAGLSEPLRSSLDYFVGIRTVPVQGDATPCSLLLVYDTRKPGRRRLAPEWQPIWEFQRGGGRQLEYFQLYRRAPT